MLLSAFAMALASAAPVQSSSYTIEAYDVYIYCHYDMGGRNYVISDIMIENNARGGHARAHFEAYLKTQTGKKWNIASCVASLTPERAHNGRQRFIENNNRDGSTARGVPISGDFRSEKMSWPDKKRLLAGETVKSAPAAKANAADRSPKSGAEPAIAKPVAKPAMPKGESIEERQANERREVALYEQQKAKDKAENARVAAENARRQAAYRAEVARRDAEYRAKLAAREAEIARVRADWAARAARCKAGDKAACVSQAIER